MSTKMKSRAKAPQGDKAAANIITKEKTLEILADVKDKLIEAHENRNIANSERLLSVAAGAYVFYTGILGIFNSPFTAIGEVALGGALMLRGATGYCPLKDALTARRDITIIEHKPLT